MSILFFFGFCNVSSDKQDTEDILRSCALALRQIVMADKVFQTEKKCSGFSCAEKFSVKLSPKQLPQMSILEPYFILPNHKTSVGYRRKLQNSTEDFRSVTLKTVVLFGLFSPSLDAVSQLLEHKEENPRVIPARFLSDYFKSVVQGNHTLFREYSYTQKTPHNKASFIQVFWKCFRHIGKNGDLLSAKEYHSLICLLCPDFPLEPVQKTARIILMEDAIDCLMSFADFLYAFQTQFFYEEFIEKLHSTYQALLSGTYRHGQIVVAVPTLSGPPQHKSQIPVASNTTHDEGLGNSIDGVDARSFLEAVLQILHTSNNAFSCPPADVIKDLLSCVDRVTFYGFLISLAKHEGVNASIGTLPDKSAIMEETDQELSSQAPRPKSCRPKSGMTGAVKKGL